MQPVEVEIESVQTDQAGNEEEISYVTSGKLYKKDTGYYLRYKEEISETEETMTTLKIQEMTVTLIRKGEMQLKQEFKAGENGSFVYQTPYGKFNFELKVEKVEIKAGDKRGQVELEYTLSEQGKLVSRNELFINYKYEEDNNG